MRLRSWGQLGLQFAFRSVWAPLLLMFALMLQDARGWVGAFWAAVGLVVVCHAVGATFTSTLTDRGIDLSGPGLRRHVPIADVAVLHLGSPYGQSAAYDPEWLGCAFSVELSDGRLWLLPGGLCTRRRVIAPPVVAWAEQHGIDVPDRPNRPAPPFVRSVRAWYALPE